MSCCYKENCQYCTYNNKEKKEEKSYYKLVYKAKTDKGDYKRVVEEGIGSLYGALETLEILTRDTENNGYHVFYAAIENSANEKVYELIENKNEKYNYEIHYYGKNVDIDELDKILEREQ